MLTDRFSEALTFAERLHREQRRKGTTIPYVAHLMAVASAVLEWGGDEDTAIAALLHDAVEDQGGMATADEIRRRFGDRVADMVLGCSDSFSDAPGEKAPWKDRKLAYLSHLPDAYPGVALIAACDKLHNLRAMIRDVERDGVATLNRFTATPEQSVWYFNSVANGIAGKVPEALVGELRSHAAVFGQIARSEAA